MSDESIDLEEVLHFLETRFTPEELARVARREWGKEFLRGLPRANKCTTAVEFFEPFVEKLDRLQLVDRALFEILLRERPRGRERLEQVFGILGTAEVAATSDPQTHGGDEAEPSPPVGGSRQREGGSESDLVGSPVPLDPAPNDGPVVVVEASIEELLREVQRQVDRADIGAAQATLAVAESRRCSAPRDIAAVHLMGCRILYFLGRYDEARAKLDSAVDMTVACGDVDLQALARAELGNVLAAKGEYPQAVVELQRADARATTAVPEWIRAHVCLSYGVLQLRVRDLTEARKTLNRALRHAQQANDSVALASASLYLGDVLTHLGHRKKAEACLRKAKIGFQEAGASWGLVYCVASIAYHQFCWGKTDDAWETLQGAEEACRGCGDRHAEARFDALRALVLASNGHLSKAELYAEASLNAATADGDRNGRTRALRIRAAIRIKRKAAESKVEADLTLAGELLVPGYAGESAWLDMTRAQLDSREGRTEAAEACYARAAEDFATQRQVHGEALAHWRLFELLRDSDREKASFHRTKAQRLYQEMGNAAAVKRLDGEEKPESKLPSVIAAPQSELAPGAEWRIGLLIASIVTVVVVLFAYVMPWLGAPLAAYVIGGVFVGVFSIVTYVLYTRHLRYFQLASFTALGFVGWHAVPATLRAAGKLGDVSGNLEWLPQPADLGQSLAGAAIFTVSVLADLYFRTGVIDKVNSWVRLRRAVVPRGATVESKAGDRIILALVTIVVFGLVTLTAIVAVVALIVVSGMEAESRETASPSMIEAQRP